MTWAKEKDITASVTPDKYRWYATGPCHGIVKQFEPHKGRIVVPCNHNTTTSGAGRSHVIYSDDKGETWHLGVQCGALQLHQDLHGYIIL